VLPKNKDEEWFRLMEKMNELYIEALRKRPFASSGLGKG